MGSHVASQAATGGERGVAHEALISFQARVGPDVSLEDSRRGKAPAALHTLKGSFSCMRPGGTKKETVMHKTVGLTFFFI